MRLLFKISYYLRTNHKNKEGKCSVMIRISLNGEMINLGTSGLAVVPEKWDNRTGRMKSKTAEALKFNYDLDAITTSLNAIYQKLVYEDNVSLLKIKQLFLGNNSTKVTFLELLDEYNQEAKETIGINIVRATYLRYQRVHKYFREFLMEKYKVKDIKIKELNHDMLDKFINYLKVKKHYSYNSAAKLVQHIKTISDNAYKRELIVVDPIKDYKFSLEETDRGFLLESELKKIMKKKFSCKRLEIVRDIFIFSCFTGLAYIDVANLTQENLIENEGRYWIMTKRQKTKTASNILLLDIPLKILKKYKGQANNNRLLPVSSNQKVNAYLKEIADICKINKNLTFHLARHTFATTVTLEKGVPIETVSKMLGHTNIKTTQIYARITTKKIQSDMLILAGKLTDYKAV